MTTIVEDFFAKHGKHVTDEDLAIMRAYPYSAPDYLVSIRGTLEAILRETVLENNKLCGYLCYAVSQSFHYTPVEKHDIEDLISRSLGNQAFLTVNLARAMNRSRAEMYDEVESFFQQWKKGGHVMVIV